MDMLLEIGAQVCLSFKLLSYIVWIVQSRRYSFNSATHHNFRKCATNAPSATSDVIIGATVVGAVAAVVDGMMTWRSEKLACTFHNWHLRLMAVLRRVAL